MPSLAVVTGASSGLGAALLRAAPAGAHRVDVSRSGRAHDGGEHVRLDLSDPAAWPAFATAFERLVAASEWARITVIHNAGTIEPIGFAGEVDAEAYCRNVLLNSAASQVLGNLVLRAVRGLSARRELVLISSGAAARPYAGWSSYGAGKAAGDQWVRAVGREQELRGGAKVLSVAPGVVATGMQAHIRGTDARDFPAVERFHQLHDEGILLDADEVAGRVWALLDDPEVTTGTVTDLRQR